MFLGDQELATFVGGARTWLSLSPDGLKLMITDGEILSMYIVYLHDPKKLKERTQVFSLESRDYHVCWFQDSERIVIAYEDKF